MKYIYLQKYTDGSKDFFYVGKHQWSGITIDPDYRGSGSRLQDYTWVSQYLLEDCTQLTDEEYNYRESVWIKYYAKLFGVVPFQTWEDDLKKDFYQYVRPNGQLLNCHSLVAPPNKGSGLWCCDNLDPMSLPEISDHLNVAHTTVTTALSTLNIDKSDPNAQFFYHGHWIHRPGASLDPSAPAIQDIQKANAERWTEEVKGKQKDKAKRQWGSNEFRDKRSETLRMKRPRYRLIDGFEGDYEQIAAHIGFNGKIKDTVSRYLRHPEKIPPKWNLLFGAKEV